MYKRQVDHGLVGFAADIEIGATIQPELELGLVDLNKKAVTGLHGCNSIHAVFTYSIERIRRCASCLKPSARFRAPLPYVVEKIRRSHDIWEMHH